MKVRLYAPSPLWQQGLRSPFMSRTNNAPLCIRTAGPMKFTLSLLLPLLLCALAPLCEISFPADRPNILLLLSDDHSYPFVSAYGDTNVNTPTLDRLAAEGAKFRRLFTACPQCV